MADSEAELNSESIDVPEKEKAELLHFIEDFNKRLEHKLDLFNKNQISCKKRPDGSTLSKLDSSLKKNSAFVKRLIENVSKLRVDLRFYGDLVSSGMLSNKEALPLLGTVLTILTTRDKENHHNVNIIISFCKHCGEDFAGLIPKHIRKLCEKYDMEVPRSTLLSFEKQNNVRSLFKDYYASLCQHLLKDHAAVQAFERQNEQLLRLKGEVRQDRVLQLETMQNDLQSLLSSTETLAELLDQPLPPLPNIGSSSDRSPVDVEEGLSLDEGIWEDEESRCFYQVFPNLQEYLPTVKSNQDQPPPEPPMSEDKLDEDLKDEDFEVEEVLKEDEPSAVEEVSCLYKFNLKFFSRALFGVPRTRLDLLPFYGRLVAILNPVIPEIATNLTSLLKQDFKYHIRKKDQINLESKIKVSRYIGELVKFGLFPNIEALYCLKLLLHDFSHHHIEMACNILETCGRYLYRHNESHRRTKIYMDDMMRLKSVTALDIRYTNMIENAYYFVNPPETTTVIKKKRPPLHDFIRKIIFQDLMYTDNERRVLKHLRMIDWENEVTADYAIKCLSSAWKIKFNRISALANLVAGLVEYQEFVGTKVVDSVLEDIRIGMEINLPKMNQRRVAMIKYFGELYNYRLIESTDVFKVNSENGQGLYSAAYSHTDDSILYEENEEDLSDEGSDNEKENKVVNNNNDDDFLLELDKMVSDNVQERLKEAIRPSQDIVVPMLGKTHKPNDKDSSFVLLVRKGNKTQCKSLNVPSDSDLVKNLKYREEVERLEKEKVKKLTLDIQRMQLEDSQEQQQDNPPPTTNVNHQRRVRYSNTQKGKFYPGTYWNSVSELH
uniref:MIF4G domain-containing protein n=1 Tax=Rhodnius prolixus TaxID=13249 RepID=T1HBU6_RHOPR